MTTIIVIDPHPLVRMGLIQLLTETLRDTTIKAKDYLQLAKNNNNNTHTTQEPCDLILITPDTEQLPCQYLQTVTEIYSPKAILLLTEPNCTTSLSLSHRYPAIRGVISKEASPEIVRASVQLVLAGGTCFPCQENQALQDPTNADCSNNNNNQTHINEAKLLGLTLRQYEVLVLLARGYPLKTIARDLCISIATAKSHTETIYQRLNVHSRNAAVYTAINSGATLGWSNIHALPT